MATEKLSSTVTKASENRRSNKPIMEKRRRARINNCLNDLKTLILEAMKKDPARHSKLEKADILEMTVKYLQSLQRQQMALAATADPTVVSKYRAGFSECAAEVNRFMSRSDAVEVHTRTRLLNHLSSCLNSLNTTTATTTTTTTPVHIQIPSSTNTGTTDLMGGIQLVPSRLPSGEIAFLLPSSQQHIIPLYSQSPSTSNGHNKHLSVNPPSPTVSTNSSMSPMGSECSSEGMSSTTCSSPTTSRSRMMCSSPMNEHSMNEHSMEEPENLSLFKEAAEVAGDRMWRPW